MIIEKFFNIPVCAEIIALLAACSLVAGKRHTYWRLFPLYLGAVLTAEWLGFSLKQQQQSSYLVYNILWIIQAIFFSYIFYRFHQSKFGKQQVLLIVGIFFTFYLSEAANESFVGLFIFSRQFLSIMIIFFSVVFYFSILKNDLTSAPLKFPPFWIVTGLFFFYLGSAIMFTIPVSLRRGILVANMSLYDVVMGFFNCVLYGSWIIAFLWKRQMR